MMKSDIRLFWQVNIHGLFAGRRACELLAVLCEAWYEAAVGEEELSVLDTHKTIEPIGFACRVVTEAGRGQLDPQLPRVPGATE